MKKIIALLLLIAAIAMTLSSCTTPENDETEKLSIGVMSGPTGMGMAKLMYDNKDNTEKYEFKIYNDPNSATADLANGTVDMLCLPTNLAANLSIKQADYISTIAVNCLGSLYLLSKGDESIEDINDLEGKTIYTSVKTSTTAPILNYILDEAGVNATVEDSVYADHDSLVAAIKNGDVDLAVLPEPKASAALKQNAGYKIALNLSTEWELVSTEPLTMGCIVVRNDFLATSKGTVDAFLTEYKASIEYIGNKANHEEAANMIVENAIIPALPIAKSALTNLYGSIVYIDGADMQAALVSFYDAIGNSQPSDEFYYK